MDEPFTDSKSQPTRESNCVSNRQTTIGRDLWSIDNLGPRAQFLLVFSTVIASDWSLLSVNTQGSLHCKQGSLYIGNIILQLPIPVVYETGSTTSCQYMMIPTSYHRNKGKVENIPVTLVTFLLLTHCFLFSWLSQLTCRNEDSSVDLRIDLCVVHIY